MKSRVDNRSLLVQVILSERGGCEGSIFSGGSYDLIQHLSHMGQGPGAVFFGVPILMSVSRRSESQAHDESEKSIKMFLEVAVFLWLK